jgi:hypothetical protein
MFVMKTIVLSIFLSFASFIPPTQSLYLGAGSNLSCTKCDPFDFVIQRYNETRTYQSDEMENFRNISIVSVNAGMAAEEGLMRSFVGPEEMR